VAVGDYSNGQNTTGASNVSIGYASLNSNTTGSYNVANGYQALAYNTTASNNTAVGYQAAYSSADVSYTTAIGFQALYAQATGGIGNNTGVGYRSLYNLTSANNVTAIGYRSGYSITTAAGSTMLGLEAGYSTTTGINNTFIGQQSGYYVTTGAKNTILGQYSGNQGGLDIRTASNYIVLSDGDGNPQLYTANGKTLVLPSGTISSGTGIAFPATQSASTDANTLDDYEVGSWTPSGVLTTAGTSASSSVAGTYTKVGRLVTVATNFTFTKGTGTGNFSVSGLPFTVGSALVYTAVTVQCEYVGLALNVVVAYANPSSTTVQFLLVPQSTSSASVLTDTALGTTATIRFSLTYSTS
jgi:hypothetical protein